MTDKTQDGPVDATHIGARSPTIGRPSALSSPSIATTNASFVAAFNQFNALSRYGSPAIDTLGTTDQVRLSAALSKARQEEFINTGMVKVDPHGGFADYARAIEAIRAKAAALGYGAASYTVPILPVPGGYVGHFGGHDIYVGI